MFSVAYVDCPTGISGDMCLGALVDAGVPLDYLGQQLKKLRIDDEYELAAETLQRNGQAATKVHVHLLKQHHAQHGHVQYRYDHDNHNHDNHDHVGRDSHDDHHGTQSHSVHLNSHGGEHDHSRHLPEISTLIQAAHYPQRVEEWSLAIFQNLAKAEALVHGMSPDQVHFHEVGATDAIVDIVGTCLGFNYLGVTQFYWSALPTGGGTVRAAHGRLPVPAPAVLRLFELRQIPIYHNGIERELVTPTGAAIATTLATQFGSPPPMQLHRVGLGAGSRDLPLPNILRLWLGCGSGLAHQSQLTTTRVHQPAVQQSASIYNESLNQSQVSESQGRIQKESVMVLETQLDDLSPQAIGYVFDSLFQAGALDVFTQSVGMKKNRLGILLTVICQLSDVERCESILFQETTTLGIRRTEQQRSILHREFHTVETLYGSVRVKVARRSPTSPVINVHPEYEDCAKLARQAGVPWLTIHQAAIWAWQQLYAPQTATESIIE